MVHIHVHTSGSTLDGACHIPELVKRAKELEMPAIAITDHGNMIKSLEFYDECNKQGIKPLIGCEFYVGEEKNRDDFHLICIAKNNKGLKNLYKLNNFAYNKNFYYKPRITQDKLFEHKEGLIVTTACLGSEFAKEFLKGNKERTIELINQYEAVFGDDFYLEIQPNKIEEQKNYNLFLSELSNEGFNIVASTDVHYVREEDFVAHDTMLAMQVKKKVNDPDRFRFSVNDFWLKPAEVMFEQLVQMGVNPKVATKSLESTMDIANKCSVSIQAEDLLPRFDGLSSSEASMALRERLNEKYSTRYSVYRQDVIDRVFYELSVLEDKGYCGYFLIVEDYVSWARNQDIYVGTGRGSAAGSMIAYILGITDVDPIKHGLLFERFLNPDRESHPDKRRCPLV